MLIPLFIFLFIQGFATSEENYEDYKKYDDCMAIIVGLRYNGNNTNRVPDIEEVLYRCPYTKNFIDCRITYFSTEFESLYNLGDFIIIKNFLEEICDENSQVHKVYAANLDCYRSMVDEWDGCNKVADDVFSEYRESSYDFQNTDIEELDEEEQEQIKYDRAFIEPYCLKHTYTSACIGTKVLETCGSEAFGNFIEIYTGGRFGRNFCGKEGENPFMKAFVDFLTSENKLVESVLVRTMFELDDK